MLKYLFVLSLVLSIGLFIKLEIMDKELITKSGYGVVKLQSTVNTVKAKTIIESWDNSLKFIARQNLYIDFFFIFFGYGLMMFSLALLLKSTILGVIPFFAVICDAAENILLIKAISGLNYSLVPIASIFDIVKISFIILFMVILCYSLFTRYIMNRMQHI